MFTVQWEITMRTRTILAAIATLAAMTAQAAPGDIQRALEAEAKQGSPAFAGFSAQRGQQFFKTRQGGDWSCATCHTDNPAAQGRHTKTGKDIAPLAPAANAERFADPAKVEKWFRRNCNDVLGRTCTAQEKGDVLAWLMSVKP